MAPTSSRIGPWPPVTYENYSWQPSTLGTSRRQQLAHRGSYRAAVTPTIADVAVELPSHVIALATDAEASLARLDATLAHSGIVPLPAVLLRSESASSSQIERLTASARSLAETEIGEGDSSNAALVIANVHAMEQALSHQGRLTLDAILNVHSTLIAPDPDHKPGLRQEQVWIGGKAAGPHFAEFVPPHHSQLPAAMADLLNFAARSDVPTLTHVALAHAQFEAIHPFTDGNGRTGRALVHMMMREAGLTQGSTVPVSAGLLHSTESYFEALTAFRAGDPAPIVERFAEASLLACDLTNQLVVRLENLRNEWRDQVKARQGATVWRLLDALPAMPVVNYTTVATALQTSAPTTFKAIDTLEAASILRARGVGKRNRVWDAVDVLDVLDEFAAGARRGRVK